MRTDVITLDYQQTDLTWDAGLVYYSALGGYAYDDRNYNDVQDLGIPLTGTKVSLYRVIDNVLLSSGCAHCYQITLQTFCPELLMIRLDTICKDTDIVGSVPFGQ